MKDPWVSRGASFHDSLAKSWNDSYQRRGFKKRLAFLRKLISPLVVPGQYWLDAGCGGGILTLELSKLGARGLATDGSREMIKAAIRDVMPLSGRFSFETIASISSIDVPGGTFDGVLCSSVLEYVDRIDETLLEFNRVLRVGGNLVLSVPNRYSLIRQLQKLVRYVSLWMRLDLFPYLGVSKHDFSSGDLVRRLEKSGFRVVSLQGFDPILPNALSSITPALYFIVAVKGSSEASSE